MRDFKEGDVVEFEIGITTERRCFYYDALYGMRDIRGWMSRRGTGNWVSGPVRLHQTEKDAFFVSASGHESYKWIQPSVLPELYEMPGAVRLVSTTAKVAEEQTGQKPCECSNDVIWTQGCQCGGK